MLSIMRITADIKGAKEKTEMWAHDTVWTESFFFNGSSNGAVHEHFFGFFFYEIIYYLILLKYILFTS